MALSYRSNLNNIAYLYSKILGFKITSSSLNKYIEENPFYPSLYCLSETFSFFNVKSSAFRIEKEDVFNIDPPFIAYVRTQDKGDDFVLVNNITSDNVGFFGDSKRMQQVTKEEFSAMFNQIVWVIDEEINQKIEEEGYFNLAKKEFLIQSRKGLIIFSVIFIISQLFTNALPSAGLQYYLGIFIIKLIGVIITSLLLLFEIDKTNPFVKKLCKAGAKTNCEAVLESSGSKIFGISWSQIGFTYFFSTFVLLFLSYYSFPNRVFMLSIINWVAVPYTLFSFYYQWRIVKRWCRMCLLVQFALIAELLWSILYYQYNIFPDFLGLHISLLLCIALPFVILKGLYPILLKAHQFKTYSLAFKRLQYNPDVFRGLLTQQRKAPDEWKTLGLDLGNPAAETVIIKVCSPFCGPCAQLHPKLDEIVEQRIDTRLKIIFINKNLENDLGATVVKHFLSISKYEPHKLAESLDDWYIHFSQNYNLFEKKYPIKHKLEEFNLHLDAMSSWCSSADITATPTIFVDGFEVPDNYDRLELIKLL